MTGRALTLALLSITATALVFTAGYWSSARNQSHLVATPGSADIGFSQDMVIHHQQAVLMAMMAMNRATPAGRPIAQSILMSQSKQIGIMRGWLEAWQKSAVSSAPMAWYPDSANQSEQKPHRAKMTMEGMASAKELSHLWQARGKAFDDLFMRLMARHHEGGVIMARAAQQTAHLDYVRNAARGMLFQQALEIAEMKARLQANGQEPLPSLLTGKKGSLRAALFGGISTQPPVSNK